MDWMGVEGQGLTTAAAMGWAGMVEVGQAKMDLVLAV